MFLRRAQIAFFAAGLAVAFLSGCKSEVKADPKFVNAFVELRLIEMTYGVDSPMSRVARQTALKNSGFTREEFLAKAEQVLNDENQWVPFQQAVVDRIDSLMKIPSRVDVTPKANPEGPAALKSTLPKPAVPAHKGGVH